MSFLKSKHSGWLADGTRTPFADGGGGSSQPTQSTTYNTNIPEYARPYVENMLQSTQKQIYNDDMTTFRPYQPYSTDVNNYFAGFSPLQKQVQSETANMQTPEQYATATGLTGAGTLGALGLAGRAAGVGSDYASMATDPRAVSAYMSPYMQNVVDYQKSQALRDYGIGQGMRKAQSVGQGAFGGSRQAIQESEAERSLGSQLQNIAATGSQNAFQNAQQAQQFGANLGLQGYQTGLQGINSGLQGAGQLANIGTQQQASDLARLNAQNAIGGQQQTLEQNKINQAIQNYATAQQYPFMQLGIMNSMLRGLPLQQTTTASYQAQPSAAQQLTGLGGAAASYFGGKKEGGIIGMKEGGAVPGYKYGDLISDPQLQGMSNGLSPEQLQGRIADQQVTPNERGIFQGTQQAQQRMASNPMAAQQMAQAAPPPQMAQAPTDAGRMGGIAQAGGDMFNTMGYAGGGIIAFAGGDIVEEQRLQAEKDAAAQDEAAKAKKVSVKTAAKEAPKETPSGREAMLAQTQAMMEKQGFKPGASADEQAYADLILKQQAGLGEATSAKERANRAKAFLKMGANPRGFLPGAIEGAESYITGAGEIAASKEAREATLAEAKSKYSAGLRARAAGDIAASDKLFQDAAQLENQLKIAQGNNAATRDAASITAAAHRDTAGAAQRYTEEQIKRIQQEHKAKTGQDLSYEEAMKRRTESTTTAADSAEMRLRSAAAGKFSDWISSGSLTDTTYQDLVKKGDKAAISKYIEEKKAQIYDAYGISPTSKTAAAPTAPAPTEISVGGKTYNRKDYPQMTDEQWAQYANQVKKG
jgi:hypothetical protein